MLQVDETDFHDQLKDLQPNKAKLRKLEDTRNTGGSQRGTAERIQRKSNRKHNFNFADDYAYLGEDLAFPSYWNQRRSSVSQ